MRDCDYQEGLLLPLDLGAKSNGNWCQNRPQEVNCRVQATAGGVCYAKAPALRRAPVR